MFPQVFFQNRLLLKQCSSKRRYLLIFDTQITNSSLEVLKGPAVEQKWQHIYPHHTYLPPALSICANKYFSGQTTDQLTSIYYYKNK